MPRISDMLPYVFCAACLWSRSQAANASLFDRLSPAGRVGLDVGLVPPPPAFALMDSAELLIPEGGDQQLVSHAPSLDADTHPPYNVTVVDMLANCNRKDSRRARTILREHVYYLVDKYHYELPAECPWAASRDLYHLHEKSKLSRSPRRTWTCSVCGKKVHSEVDLHKHIVAEHSHLLGQDDATVCLADHCDLLKCTPRRHCRVGRMQRRRLQCDDILDECFPVEARASNPDAMAIYNIINADICERLTCHENGYVEPRVLSRRHHDTMFRVYILIGCILFVFVAIVVVIGVTAPADADLRYAYNVRERHRKMRSKRRKRLKKMKKSKRTMLRRFTELKKRRVYHKQE